MMTSIEEHDDIVFRGLLPVCHYPEHVQHDGTRHPIVTGTRTVRHRVEMTVDQYSVLVPCQVAETSSSWDIKVMHAFAQLTQLHLLIIIAKLVKK